MARSEKHPHRTENQQEGLFNHLVTRLREAIITRLSDDVYYAVVNPEYSPTGPVTFAREGSDEAVYENPEKAYAVRDRLAEKHGNEALTVKPVGLFTGTLGKVNN